MGFLYFLLGLFLLGLLFQLFFRYILPLILLRYVRKKQKQQEQFFNKNPKEGEIKIKKQGDNKNHLDPDVGEYVDFEDVDDE